MAKYRVDTTGGSYIVETEDTPPAADLATQTAALGGGPAPAARAPVPIPAGLTSDQAQIPSMQLPPGVINPLAWGTTQRGGEQILGGLEHIAGSMGRGGPWYDPAAPQYQIQDTRHAAAGASDVIRGTLETQKPTLPFAAAAAPVATLAGLGVGMATSPLVETGLQAAGVAPEYSRLAGDVAGLAAGGKAAEVAPGLAARGVGAALDRMVLPRSGTPEQQAAVDWALAHGAPLNAGAATLNPLIRGAEEIARSTPGAAAPAQRAIEARNLWYAQQGRALAEGVSPAPVTPETVGRSIAQQSVSALQQTHAEASAEYNALRDRELDPRNITRVQTGTRDVPDFDENGNQYGSHQEPVFENIGLPVDMSGVKAAARPILAQISRLTDLGQQQYAPMQVALEDLIRGPDMVAASTAEKNLSAIKKESRAGELVEGSGVRNEAGGLAADTAGRLQSAIDKAVLDHAGPDALNELQTGRLKTAQKYEAIDLVKRYRDEPVKLYQQLTQARDGGIDFLRSVTKLAPESGPQLGRAWLDGAIDHATESGGFDHAGKLFNDWQMLGPESKKILFRDPAMVSDLDKFFQSAKDSARIENTSGTSRVSHFSAALGGVVVHPVAGATYLVGMNALSRLLYNPRFVRAAIRGFQLPATAAGAGVAASAIAQAARSAGIEPGGAPPGEAPPSAPSAPSAPGTPPGAPPAPAAGGGAAAATGGTPTAGAPVASSTGTIAVPGKPGPGYQVNYQWQHINDVQASHNGLNFQPNPQYPYENQRNYSTAANQGKIVQGGSRSDFNPEYHVVRAPDATHGPVITDERGAALGANGRKMMLERVRAGNPAGWDAYGKLADERAAQFGLGPRPSPDHILTAVISDAELAKHGGAQNAIADFNKSGTAALTPEERSISDSRRVSGDTLEHVSGLLEKKGADATLNDALSGSAGIDVLNRLIKDDVISPQERAGLATNDELTPAGRQRIGALVVGRFFKDPQQISSIGPQIRGKIERLAAPLSLVDGRGEWDLTPHVREALDILQAAQARGIKNVGDYVQQNSLFGASAYDPRAVELAQLLKSRNSLELQRAARQYADDASYAAKGGGGGGLFGDVPTPERAFADSFGKPPAPAPANALAGKPGGAPGVTVREETAVEAPKNVLAGQGGAMQFDPKTQTWRSVNAPAAAAPQGAKKNVLARKPAG